MILVSGKILIMNDSIEEEVNIDKVIKWSGHPKDSEVIDSHF